MIVHFDDGYAPGGVAGVIDFLIAEFGGELCRNPMSQAWRFASLGQADILVVHSALAWKKLPFLAAIRARHRRCKVVLIEHHYTRSFEQHLVPAKWRFRAMLRSGYGIVDHVVSVSKGQADWIRGVGLAPATKVAVIPCVVDLAAFEQIDLPRPHCGPMRLGALGRLHPQKGFETLIEAMRMVSPEVATLDIAGSGPLEGSLKALAQDLPHVSFRGWTRPTDFYASVDTIVMPSRWEPGAVACWEARASGRPMIVSDVDGLPEQVSPEIGFVTPPGNAAALAHAVKVLACADRVAMSDAARRSTAGAVQQTKEAWRKLLTPADAHSYANAGTVTATS